jgi:hypothetical protein
MDSLEQVNRDLTKTPIPKYGQGGVTHTSLGGMTFSTSTGSTANYYNASDIAVTEDNSILP